MRYSSYLTPDGARVPLVIQGASPGMQGVHGFQFLTGVEPTLSQSRSANSFLRKFPEGKIIFATQGLRSAEILDSRALIAPISALL